MLYYDVNCATEVMMQLWWQWWSLVAPLRAACTRQRSFLWLASALAGYSARADLLGVTSIVRTLGLAARCYDRLLDFFHSPAVDIETLTRCWVRQVLHTLPLQRTAGRPVLLGDGIKVAKAGRKMPAVKLLHQPGESNTKPPYIMGHSIQVVSVLVGAADSHLAVPLAGRIHEGVKFTNRDQRTLPGKCCDLLDSLGLEEPFYFVADAYYGCKTVALRLRGSASHLISRVRRSAVAYLPAPAPAGRRKRGRPRLYGKRIKLWTLFDSENERWQSAESPVYGERGVTIRFLSRDLIWRPVRALMRFVLVDHPTRGRSIFITTDLSLAPIEVIRLYGLRFKIELSFKHSLRVLGTYAYHFWLRAMPKISRGSGTQHLHRASDRYRNAVRRKLDAYHRHIQVGLIAQGLLQTLAIQHPRLVWSSFGSWLRTIRPGIPPSELVTAAALRHSLPDFLAQRREACSFQKFLRERLEPAPSCPLRLTG
jgi:hypothetical protein